MMILRSSQGATLIETLVVAGIISMLAIVMATMISNQQNALRNIEVKSNFMTLSRDIDLVMQSETFCQSAFRQTNVQNLTYNPPANINTAYSQAVPFVYSGTTPIVSLGINAENPGLNVTSMTLQRRVGTPVEATTFADPVTGVVTNVRKHLADFQVAAVRVGGTLAGQTLTKRGLLNIFVDPSNNRVITCQLSSRVQLTRAIARRSGLTAVDRTCMENVDPTSVPSRVQANPGCDGDGDGFCDSDAHFVAAAHPDLADGTRTIADWGLSTTSSIGAPGQEGRCSVSLTSVPASENAANIFRIYNAATGSAFDGLGCNTPNGWYLSGCFSANNGLGDSDIVVRTDGLGEYCVTNDFTQPHYKAINLVWGIKSSGVTVICTKFE